MNYERYPYEKYKGIYRIESARYEKWDYSNPGIYFVTFCTWDRQPILAICEDGKYVKTALGVELEKACYQISAQFPNCTVDEFVVMPDHFHGVIFIKHKTKDALSNIVGFIKGRVTKFFNEQGKSITRTLWQSRFHDRIIRDEQELNMIRDYIRDNPEKELFS